VDAVADLVRERDGDLHETGRLQSLDVIADGEGAGNAADVAASLDALRIREAILGDDVADPDLEWDAMIRAGRTDPAGAEELPPGAAYSPERSAEEQIAVLTSSRPPYAAAELRRLLQV